MVCWKICLLSTLAVAAALELSPAAWCARGTGETEQALLQRCCRLGSENCFEIADAVGGKCCRQDIDVGFYGFLLPPRSFSLNGVPHELDSCSVGLCLFSLKNFRTLSDDPAEATSELLQLGLLSREWRPDLPFLGPTSPILMDMVRVNGLSGDPPIFYHRLFHDHAEVVTQALWEYSHWMGHSAAFTAALAARRGRGAPCEQREAALQAAMADTTALPWLARRWALQGNAQLDTFVNIGAREGVHEDPLYPLLQNPADVRFSLAVEMKPEFCEEHARNLPHVPLLCMRATKASVSEIVARLPDWLRGQKRPSADLLSLPRLDVLKVDVDGADCDIVASFLWRVLAKFVVLEVCDAVPPPLRFALHDSEHLSWPPVAPWGCSLSYQVQLMKQFGLELVWYGAGNAIFAHRLAAQLLGLPSPLDEVDCYSKSVLMTMWPSGRKLRRWFYEESLNETLREIQSALRQRLGDLTYTMDI
ncbi:unnamed protein product [Symbiodinium natans]|uniref:Methyltransferase FkbM domain-containing protein n=1 Tax=Symbiodinium natans TaxID=878477 RepID=A0A812R5J3_9DINO|nr:unnamed protein product [Symbiodinium natans]